MGIPRRDYLLKEELTASQGEKRAWSANYAPIFKPDAVTRAITTASIQIANQKCPEAVGCLASSISHEIHHLLETIRNLLYLKAVDQVLFEGLSVYADMAQ